MTKKNSRQQSQQAVKKENNPVRTQVQARHWAAFTAEGLRPCLRSLHENGGHATNRLRSKGSNISEFLPARRRPGLAGGGLPSGGHIRGLAKRRPQLDGEEATGDRVSGAMRQPTTTNWRRRGNRGSVAKKQLGRWRFGGEEAFRLSGKGRLGRAGVRTF
jgi:hypothetical protein